MSSLPTVFFSFPLNYLPYTKEEKQQKKGILGALDVEKYNVILQECTNNMRVCILKKDLNPLFISPYSGFASLLEVIFTCFTFSRVPELWCSMSNVHIKHHKICLSIHSWLKNKVFLLPINQQKDIGICTEFVCMQYMLEIYFYFWRKVSIHYSSIIFQLRDPRFQDLFLTPWH